MILPGFTPKPAPLPDPVVITKEVPAPPPEPVSRSGSVNVKDQPTPETVAKEREEARKKLQSETTSRRGRGATIITGQRGLASDRIPTSTIRRAQAGSPTGGSGSRLGAVGG